MYIVCTLQWVCSAVYIYKGVSGIKREFLTWRHCVRFVHCVVIPLLYVTTFIWRRGFRTMASGGFGIFQPPPFLQNPGDPPVVWKQWISLFQTYLTAIGADEDFSHARKKALLLHCLGVEGQRIFSTLPGSSTSHPKGSEPFIYTLEILKSHFEPTLNVVAERYWFRQRTQQVGETFENYIASLRELAKTCDFGTFMDQMIRDQIVEKTNSPKVRERLLMEKDLTLQKASTCSRQGLYRTKHQRWRASSERCGQVYLPR